MAVLCLTRLPVIAVQLAALILLSFQTSVESTNQYLIHWNTTNPIFQISNTDHVIDVNKGNGQFEYDQATIICPSYDPHTMASDPEKYIIYNVSREEYETCRITDPNPRIIAICDKPDRLMFFTITFRSFTPQPGGLEFNPGQDYYFISTSSKNDLQRRIGGRCSSHHMKLVFKVCCNETEKDTHLLDTNRPADTVVPDFIQPISNDLTDHVAMETASRSPVNNGGGGGGGYTTRGWRHSQRVNPAVPATSSPRPAVLHSYKGLQELYDLHLPSINVKATTKVSDEYSKNSHPNDIAFNEGLTSSATSLTSQRLTITTALLCTTTTTTLLLLLLRILSL